jgi:hypothetical protein
MGGNVKMLASGILTTIAVLTGATHPARADEIVVQTTAGLSSTTEEKTILEFSTTTNEALPVNRIEGTVVATTGDSARAFARVCVTPCALSVEPGYYRMGFGYGGAFDPGIGLSVNGGKHAYDVSRLGMGAFSLEHC